MAYDEELAKRVRRALRGRSDITERKMFGGLTFLRDGRMCVGTVGQELVVRIVDDEMPGVMQQRHVRPMDFTGKPLRGFVFVGPEGFSTATALKAWIARGLRFAGIPEGQRNKPASRRTRKKPRVLANSRLEK